MSSIHPRDRLLRDDPALPTDLRRAFAAYADITPAEQTRADLLARIERAATAPASQLPLRSRSLWWWSGLSVLGLAGLGLFLALGPLAPAGTPLERDHASSTLAGAASAASSRTVSSRAEPASDEPSLVGPSRAASSATEPSRSAPALVEPSLRRSDALVASGQPASRGSTSEGRVAERKRAPAQKQSALLVDPAQELALLTRAKQVLPRDAHAALALTDEHAARFPRGTFSEEREVIAIEALLRDGHHAQARERAAIFRASYPRSTHLDRLRVVLREP